MEIWVTLGKREELVFVSREVGLGRKIKVHLKAFDVVSVRVIGVAKS